MPVRLGDLARHIGATLQGDEGCLVANIATLDTAQAHATLSIHVWHFVLIGAMILKKLKLFSSLIVLCGAVAGTPSRAADLRIGVVNPIKVLEAAPQAEEARKRLEREFAPPR